MERRYYLPHTFMIILLTSIIMPACINSNRTNSEQLIGSWSFENSYQNSLSNTVSESLGSTTTNIRIITLSENGIGKVTRKSSTVYDSEDKLNSSYTIEHPITWQTKKDESDSEYLIMKYEIGKLVDVTGENNKSQNEQNGIQAAKIFNGISDTLYFSILNDKISWHFPDRTETFEMVKQ